MTDFGHWHQENTCCISSVLNMAVGEGDIQQESSQLTSPSLVGMPSLLCDSRK